MIEFNQNVLFIKSFLPICCENRLHYVRKQIGFLKVKLFYSIQ